MNQNDFENINLLQKDLLAAELKNQVDVFSFLEKNPLILNKQDILGIGASRVGILCSEDSESEPLVAKLAWSQTGTSNNRTEYLVWRYSLQAPLIHSSFSISCLKEKKLSDLIAPIVKTNDLWNLQVYCTPIRFQANDEKQLATTKALAEYGISDTAVNLGFYKNQIVCFDYCWVSTSLYSEINKK